MEIVIKIDRDQIAVTGAAATQQSATEQGVTQPGGEPMSPPTDVTARAEATGAIDAGPAHIPTGQAGQPLADIAAAAHQQQQSARGGDTSAGAAPGYAEEPTPTMVEVEAEKSGKQKDNQTT